MPSDAQTSAEAVQVNSIESAFLAGVEGPCFAAIQQCAEHAASLHLHLGVVDQNGIVPHPFCKESHCCCCFQLRVQGEVAGDGGCKSSTTSRVELPTEMLGMLLTA